MTIVGLIVGVLVALLALQVRSRRTIKFVILAAIVLSSPCSWRTRSGAI